MLSDEETSFQRYVLAPNGHPMGILLDGGTFVRLSHHALHRDAPQLKAGDMVLLNGTVFTGRDAVHQYLHKGGELEAIRNGVIYHCGPVVLEEGGKFRVVAAGPTTSTHPPSPRRRWRFPAPRAKRCIRRTSSKPCWSACCR